MPPSQSCSTRPLAPAATRSAPTSVRLFILRGVPGQRQEHVIERRPAQRQPVARYVRGIQRAHRLDQRVGPAGPDAHADHAGLRVGVRLSLADRLDRRHRVGDPAAVGHGELDHVPADPVLQLLGRARGDDQAVVDDHDLVRQFVGLVEVLGGQQQRGSLGHQRPDDVPHAQPRPRVQAGGRFVQEQHPRPADQARGQVQAPLHAAGVGLRGPVGRVGQPELLQQLDGPAAGLRPAQVVQPPDDLQVLPAGQLFLDGGRLPGQPDRPAHRGRLPDHVVALDHRPPPVREQQGGQDAYRGGLARAVGPEHAEHRPARHGQVDTAQRVHLPERLGQALHQDRRLLTCLVEL